MQKLILIESAKELFDMMAEASLTHSDDLKGSYVPALPMHARLVFENNNETVQLQNAKGFILSDKITTDDIINEAITRHGFDFHVT